MRNPKLKISTAASLRRRCRSGRRCCRLFVFAVGLPIFFAVAAPVLAQSVPDLRAELEARLSSAGVSQADQQQIHARLVRLETRDLPVRPVLDRYLQGLAKGVPLPRIEIAADRLEGVIQEVAAAVDQTFPPARVPIDRPARLVLIDDGACAIGAGVVTSDLSATMKLAVTEPNPFAAAAPPVQAVGILVSSGMSAGPCLEVVRTAWEHGFRGEDLERLGQDLASLSRPGQGPPPDMIDRVLGLLREDAGRDRVFRHLDALRGPPGPGGPVIPPGEDPGRLRGPGGPPRNPGHLDPGGAGPGGHPDGPGHPPPPPPSGGSLR